MNDTTIAPQSEISTRAKPWMFFVLGCLVFLTTALRRDLWAPDEPRHAEVAAEMVRSGDYVIPQLNGEVYSDKPPPPFWVMVTSMRMLGGPSEFAARLPFAIGAGLTLALLFSIARRLFGAQVAFSATLIMMTAGQFMWLAQRVSLDIFQTLFVTLAIYGWLRQQRGEGSSWVNGLIFFLACGCGISTKGPTALLVPLSAAIGHALASKTLSRLRDPRFLAGIVAMAAFILGWLIPASRRGGEAYTHDLVFTQSFGRIANAWNHEHPFFYYFGEWPIEFLPWSPAFLLAIWLAWREKGALPGRSEDRRLLYSWIAIPFLVLSIAQSKRGNYLLPLYPAAAMLAALAVHQLEGKSSRYNVLLFALMQAIVGLLGIAGLVAIVIPFTKLLEEHHLPGLELAGPLVGALLVGIAITTLRRGRNGLVAQLRTLACGILVLLPTAGLTVFPVIDAEKSERLVANRLVELTGLRVDQPIAFLDRAPESARFYSGLDCRELKEREDLIAALQSGEYRLAVIEKKKLEGTKKREPLLQAIGREITVHEVGPGRGSEVVILEVTR